MKNIFNIYNEKNLRKRTSRKWGDKDKSIIPLDIAEVDVPFDNSIAGELSYLTRLTDCGYVSQKDINEYKEVYAQYYARHHKKTIDIKSSQIYPGVIAASRILSRIYFENKKAKDSEKNIIISSPVYPPFITTIAQNYNLHDVPLNSQWRLDLVNLEKKFRALQSKPAIYLLCNPQNPTGTVHTKSELKKLVLLCNKYKIFIISDEIYSDMSAPGHFNSLLCVGKINEGVSIISPSKAYGMPGLKSSIVFPFGQAVNLLDKTPKVIEHILNHYPIRCAIAAYSKGDKYLKRFRKSLAENFSFFSSLMKEYLPKAKIYYTGAVPLAWIDMSAYKGVNAKFVLEKAYVSVNDGITFGGVKYKNFIRVNVATNQNVLKNGILRIARAITKNPKDNK
ncbi:MAG: aminotransferase class I/II-fold pyridoxal phosphate-dependent enzyme [Bifidobacteriaceae bacterium]|jgi:cystathionine beta-lyase|nr:aminotransferase class I/II-fold pyridoxal phosphate-dependent enzyme [Bifidobacteriaceae bacterium]